MENAAAEHDIQERAFRFACRILPAADTLMRRGGVATRLGGQLADAGTSIGANLEEATAGQTKPDFIAKASVALKESRECLYWLRLVQAALPHPPRDIHALREESDQLVSILTAILKKAKSSPNRGV